MYPQISAYSECLLYSVAADGTKILVLLVYKPSIDDCKRARLGLSDDDGRLPLRPRHTLASVPRLSLGLPFGLVGRQRRIHLPRPRLSLHRPLRPPHALGRRLIRDRAHARCGRRHQGVHEPRGGGEQHARDRHPGQQRVRERARARARVRHPARRVPPRRARVRRQPAARGRRHVLARAVRAALALSLPPRARPAHALLAARRARRGGGGGRGRWRTAGRVEQRGGVVCDAGARVWVRGGGGGHGEKADAARRCRWFVACGCAPRVQVDALPSSVHVPGPWTAAHAPPRPNYMLVFLPLVHIQNMRDSVHRPDNLD